MIDKSKLKSKGNDLKNDIQILRAQLGQLKQIHGYQAKSFEDMMKNAKEQILSCMQKLSTGEPSSFKSFSSASQVFLSLQNSITLNSIQFVSYTMP